MGGSHTTISSSPSNSRGCPVAVKVVTDSTADLPQPLAQELGVTVVPLNVHFGTQVFHDGVDLGPDDFFERLASASQVPTTSQPSIGDFVETYQRLASDADGIASVHISSKLSGTINSALQACQASTFSCPVEIVDTLQVSMATGLPVVIAARVAQEGGSLQQVVDVARRSAQVTQLFVMVDTLEYLEKGGRIGKAQAFLGTLLRVKPILTCRDGEVHPLERARTHRKALERLYAIAQERQPFAMAAVCHSTTPDEAEELAERLRPLCDGDVIVSRFGPVLSTHVGPGALGIAIQKS